MLIHPTLGAMLVHVRTLFSYSDKRTAGGYVEFDMQFVEAGMPAMMAMTDAGGNLTDAAGNAEGAGVSSINSSTRSRWQAVHRSARAA